MKVKNSVLGLFAIKGCKLHNNKAFSLLELLCCLVIVSIITCILIGPVIKCFRKSVDKINRILFHYNNKIGIFSIDDNNSQTKTLDYFREYFLTESLETMK